MAVDLLPPAPVAVSVYVVVTAGARVNEPLVASVWEPGWSVTDVVLVVDHCNEMLWPAVMLVAEAVAVIVGGGAATVMVTAVELVPPGPLAVSVYVVVEVGFSVSEPFVANVCPPGCRVTVVALTAVQLSTKLSPAVMLA
jgi:hypothetical protein